VNKSFISNLTACSISPESYGLLASVRRHVDLAQKKEDERIEFQRIARRDAPDPAVSI
jgi:hypothetical protein